MFRFRRIVAVSLLAFSGVAAAQPASARTAADCFNDVLDRCADAMEGSNFLERFALGVICSGMLAGCAG